MAKQVINIGTGLLAGDGESIRDAFIKTNDNFSEVYDTLDTIPVDISDLTDNDNLLGSGSGSVNRAWTDTNGNVFNIIEWASGTTVTIGTTDFEQLTLTTFDSRTDSNYIYFVWDQEFIDGVWDGWQNELGEGQSYSLSFDNGQTWVPVETSGYNGGTFFYFRPPYELEGIYTFTYEADQSVLIRFNRGSLTEPWFTLENAPVDANSVIAVDLSVVADVTIFGEPARTGKIVHPNFRFANVLYDDNSGAGGINEGDRIWLGDSYATDRINIDIRRTSSSGDSGRVYASFNDGQEGTITFYWNAKLYTITSSPT